MMEQRSIPRTLCVCARNEGGSMEMGQSIRSVGRFWYIGQANE